MRSTYESILKRKNQNNNRSKHDIEHEADEDLSGSEQRLRFEYVHQQSFSGTDSTHSDITKFPVRVQKMFDKNDIVEIKLDP